MVVGGCRDIARLSSNELFARAREELVAIPFLDQNV
jgi:hypothetical protein